MARHYQDTGFVYRVRLSGPTASGGTWEYYLGPYVTESAAKALRTREMQYRREVNIDIERAATSWEPIA